MTAFTASHYLTDIKTTTEIVCVLREKNLRKKTGIQRAGEHPRIWSVHKGRKKPYLTTKNCVLFSELESLMHCHCKSSILQLLFYLNLVHRLFSDPENVSFSTGCTSANHYPSTCCYTQNIHFANNSNSNYFILFLHIAYHLYKMNSHKHAQQRWGALWYG